MPMELAGFQRSVVAQRQSNGDARAKIATLLRRLGGTLSRRSVMIINQQSKSTRKSTKSNGAYHSHFVLSADRVAIQPELEPFCAYFLQRWRIYIFTDMLRASCFKMVAASPLLLLTSQLASESPGSRFLSHLGKTPRKDSRQLAVTTCEEQKV